MTSRTDLTRREKTIQGIGAPPNPPPVPTPALPTALPPALPPAPPPAPPTQAADQVISSFSTLQLLLSAASISSLKR